MSSIGGMLGEPIIHEMGLWVAIMFAALALGKGALEHGFFLPIAVGALGLGVMAGALTLPHDGTEAIYTMAGVGIVALGHRLNFMAAQ